MKLAERTAESTSTTFKINVIQDGGHSQLALKKKKQIQLLSSQFYSYWSKIWCGSKLGLTSNTYSEYNMLLMLFVKCFTNKSS